MSIIAERLVESLLNPISHENTDRSFYQNFFILLLLPMAGIIFLILSACDNTASTLPPLSYMLMSIQSIIIFLILGGLAIRSLTYLGLIKIYWQLYLLRTIMLVVALFGINTIFQDITLNIAGISQGVSAAGNAYKATMNENHNERIWVVNTILCHNVFRSPNHSMVQMCRLVDANDKASYFELAELKSKSFKNGSYNSKEFLAKEMEIINRAPLEIDPEILKSRMEKAVFLPTKENFFHIVFGAGTNNIEPVISYYNTLKAPDHIKKS